MNKNFESFFHVMREISHIRSSSAVLHWDQEVYMPIGSAGYRSEQLAYLAGLAHEKFTSTQMGEMLDKLSGDGTLSDKERRNVFEVKRDYSDQKKYSKEFVEALNRQISTSYLAWDDARKKNDFSSFAPSLQKLIDLKKEECNILGFEDHPYNALLNQFEKGATVATLDQLFSQVKTSLNPLLQKIMAKKKRPLPLLEGNFPKDKQWDFGLDLLKQMHYDFNRGRQDISSHPFTTSFGPTDVRVTTRLKENDLAEMVWSCIHEGGHALYEQGLNEAEFGLPSAEASSLGIHESQSRLWENQVGRSLAYWKGNFPLLLKYFPDQFKDVSPEEFYFSLNEVKPGFIRTSADELSYHFHIMIRYELEKAIISGELPVEDLTGEWNRMYKEYLGVTVPNDALGVLQDVHWSHGGFGYFPTYSLGSFYAAQFFDAATLAISGLEKEIEAGNLKPLLIWLRKNIHEKGRIYSPAEICVACTGKELDFSHFLNYATRKFGALYF